MRAAVIFFLLQICFSTCTNAQEKDSVLQLPSVTVKAFEQLITPSHQQINTSSIQGSALFNKANLVTGMNTIPGVKLEERSPGSYRVNLRGSTLRSPFGVRNVKVYWNEIPLTDPSGNTYFNQLAPNNFSQLSITKGPIASLYGIGTGGLILLNTEPPTKNEASVEMVIGSYRLKNLLVDANALSAKTSHTVSFQHLSSDGYREQTAVTKTNFSWISRIQVQAHHFLIASILYTDLKYQTPGALTLAEYQENPKASRPAAGVLPSAKAVDARIVQENALFGLNYHYQISKDLQWKTNFYGALSKLANSAVRNFEKRKEPHVGGRSQLDWKKKWVTDSIIATAGIELQKGFNEVTVFTNVAGSAGTLQTADEVKINTATLFLQGSYFHKDWIFSAGMSAYSNKINFTRTNAFPIAKVNFQYANEISPRLSVGRKINPHLKTELTLAKGFSTPTVAELLPSTAIINTDLHAERGWNYEWNLEQALLNNKLTLNLNTYYFNLTNAIVQRRDSSGADYFVNAGGTHQWGIEWAANFNHTPQHSNVLKRLIASMSYALANYTYTDYLISNNNYSKNRLPAIAKNTYAAQVHVSFAHSLFLSSSYYYSDKIFLNDANNFTSPAYHLLNIKVGWQKRINKSKLDFYFGIDNLLNEKYSLGNDINAVGNRYYNAAPLRNFYAGIAISLKK